MWCCSKLCEFVLCVHRSRITWTLPGCLLHVDANGNRNPRSKHFEGWWAKRRATEIWSKELMTKKNSMSAIWIFFLLQERWQHYKHRYSARHAETRENTLKLRCHLQYRTVNAEPWMLRVLITSYLLIWTSASISGLTMLDSDPQLLMRVSYLVSSKVICVSY